MYNLATLGLLGGDGSVQIAAPPNLVPDWDVDYGNWLTRVGPESMCYKMVS